MTEQWKKVLGVLLITIFLCELVSRYFVSRDFNTPFWRPSRILYVYYPELLSLPPELEKSKINILVLGGSAITDSLCHISKNLKKELTTNNVDVNIYNLSEFAHNTLDAKIKFKHCKELGFDYVFVYNGINDTRTNNCPDDVFREDYSQVQFYSQVDILERHPEIKYLTLPFLLDYYWDGLKIKKGWKKIIPKEYFVVNWKLIATVSDTGRENMLAIKKFISENQDKIIGYNSVPVDSLWWSDGQKIKSAKSFRNNLEYIYYHKPRNTNLILTDYAWYQPDDYSLQKFLYQKMDYGEQRWPTEIYGKPDNVTKGLKLHDKIIDSITAEHQDIVYFNFNDSIVHNGHYFNDICHLADSGQVLLSHILAQQIIHDLRKKASLR